MSNQTYRNIDVYDDRYNPSPLTNTFSALVPMPTIDQQFVYLVFDKCNGIARSAIGPNPVPPHTVNYRSYPGFISASLRDYVPQSTQPLQNYATYCQVVSSGTYVVKLRVLAEVLNTATTMSNLQLCIIKFNPVTGITEFVAVDSRVTVPAVTADYMLEANFTGYLNAGEYILGGVYHDNADVPALLSPIYLGSGVQSIFQIQKL